jgi:hypothetical protein
MLEIMCTNNPKEQRGEDSLKHLNIGSDCSTVLEMREEEKK